MSGDNLHGKQPIKFYSEELKYSKQQGLKDYEEGRVIPRSVMMEEIKAKKCL